MGYGIVMNVIKQLLKCFNIHRRLWLDMASLCDNIGTLRGVNGRLFIKCAEFLY